jgi:hypothetical protein
MKEEKVLPYSELTSVILSCCFEVMKELEWLTSNYGRMGQLVIEGSRMRKGKTSTIVGDQSSPLR